MSERKTNRSALLQVRVTPDELATIRSLFAKTTCRKLSDYHRRVLLTKPVTVNQRNQSLDDFMAEMIRLRNDLNNISKSFNKAITRLHTLQKVEEFKSWLLLYETTRKILIEKTENINKKSHKSMTNGCSNPCRQKP